MPLIIQAEMYEKAISAFIQDVMPERLRLRIHHDWYHYKGDAGFPRSFKLLLPNNLEKSR